jgi:hypothetical protein
MIIYLFIFIILLIGALTFTRFEINEKIIVDAPIADVWSTIVDFGSYSRWNSQLQYLGGEIKPGGKIHLRLSAAGANPYEFKPIISHWVVNERFAWIGRTGLPRVFDGEHFFELEQVNAHTTLVTNREEYRGVLSLIMKNLPMMKTAPEGFRKMNQELKDHLEKNR